MYRESVGWRIYCWAEAVANGDKVTLVGFGSFERRVHEVCRRYRSEREGRNPKTNKVMTIPATRRPGLFMGSCLKKKQRQLKTYLYIVWFFHAYLLMFG
ncbi:HU family DNA-binding protein [Nostocaceae cyanobacterium CENA357]|uniref:HU family DNA-binding protein n=1 Tax=Atlanticothrix silvestris CENA357 TaxID=1725252 RepID=A0A8J7L534_9CYAN|nr:HU family DNA-binding protein [Atlanticothrix silvestris]MBH8554237.1 HU family DNA-binding protein [Atlanticothrix silvestris CENA357]